MKRFAIIVLAGIYVAPAWGAVAMWTGRSEQVQTVTYKTAWKCEYSYNGQNFWRLFDSFCPASVQVQ